MTAAGKNVLEDWTLAVQTTEEVAGSTAGLYTLPQACNEVRATYTGAKPTVEGALLILPTEQGKTLLVASAVKHSHAAANGESVEVADGTWVDRVSVFLGTAGTVDKTTVMGRFKKRKGF